MMQNSDDTATLEIFFLHTYSLFIVYSFPPKNAHKNATGFETKREHWYHLGLVFLLDAALIYLLLLWHNLCV